MGVLGLVALALILTAFYAAPATVFLFNGSEVTTSVEEILPASWRVQVGLVVVVVVLGLIGRRPGRRLLAAVLLALAGLLYLQGNVFVWDYGKFDGIDIDWARHRLLGWAEAAVWLGLLVAAVVFHRRLWKHVPRIAIIIALLNVVSLGAYRMSGRTFAHATASGIDDQLYHFSRQQNTLIVIMDAFASPAFDLMLADDPAWRERLSGFTYYQDALGVYPTTLPSIPAILSGETFDNSQPVATFLRESLTDASLPKVLQDRGFLTHTITEAIYGKYLEAVPYANQISFLDSRPQNRKRRDALRIWNVALFRYAPHFVKRRVYDDHRWLLREGGTAAGSESVPDAPFSTDEAYRAPSPGQKASWLLWRQLLDNAKVAGSKPTFKFVHFFTTHTPYFLDADCAQLTHQEYGELGWVGAVRAQSTCALNQVLELLDRLEELGVLDNTLVILASDHGSHIDLVGRPDDGIAWDRIPEVTKVLPLLLVKPIGAKGPLRISQAPVSLIDIPNTVMTDLGIAYEFSGQALQSAEEDQARARVYYDYTWEHNFWWEDYLPPMTEYRVNGPARNPDSWSEGQLLTLEAGK
jgi:hypothetical protein